jgi:hypothetical protein
MIPAGRRLPFLIGVVTVLVLGAIIAFRPAQEPRRPPPATGPREELDLFLSDRMNYGVRFSILLAQRRIERCAVLAREHPEYSRRARAVADSLRARLRRRAVVP